MCICSSLTADYSSVNWLTEQKRPNLNILAAFAPSQVLTQRREAQPGLNYGMQSLIPPGLATGRRVMLCDDKWRQLCAINKRLLQCFVSPLFDCAKV